MANGIIHQHIAKHREKIEQLTAEMTERELAGQRRITKLCKEHSDMMEAMQSQIARHEKIASDLELYLEEHNGEGPSECGNYT